MNIKALKVYCDVVDRRSFSRAAEDNELSQSTASQLVLDLEERLGVRLIDRSHRPFELTEEGKRFYEGCRDIVRRYFDLEQDVRSLHDESARRLVIASIYSVGLAHMKKFVQRFTAEHPKSQLRLDYLHPKRVMEVVEQGEVDLGIVSYPQATRDLEVIQWRSEPLAVVCHPGHPFAQQQSIELHALAGAMFVAFESDLVIRRAIDRALAAGGTEVNVTLEFDNVETIKRAIEIDAGVSILPVPTLERELAMGTLAAVAITGTPITRPLGIVHRKDRPLSEVAREFVALLTAEGTGNRRQETGDRGQEAGGRASAGLGASEA